MTNQAALSCGGLAPAKKGDTTMDVCGHLIKGVQSEAVSEIDKRLAEGELA